NDDAIRVRGSGCERIEVGGIAGAGIDDRDAAATHHVGDGALERHGRRIRSEEGTGPEIHAQPGWFGENGATEPSRGRPGTTGRRPPAERTAGSCRPDARRDGRTSVPTSSGAPP